MDFPKPEDTQVEPIFLTTAAEYRRQYGKVPLLTSAVWGQANDILAAPVKVRRRMTVKKLYCFNGAAVSGNCDIALFGPYGRFAVSGSYWMTPRWRLTSAGSTAQAGISVWQAFNVADFVIPPGMYWIAYGLDNITGAVTRLATQAANMNQLAYLVNANRLQTTGIPISDNNAGIPLQTYTAEYPLLALGGIA